METEKLREFLLAQGAFLSNFSQEKQEPDEDTAVIARAFKDLGQMPFDDLATFDPSCGVRVKLVGILRIYQEQLAGARRDNDALRKTSAEYREHIVEMDELARKRVNEYDKLSMAHQVAVDNAKVFDELCIELTKELFTARAEIKKLKDQKRRQRQQKKVAK